MNLYDKIANAIKKNNVEPINLNLLNEDGGVDIDATMRVLDQTTPLTFGERMLGRELNRNFQKYNPDTKQFEMTTATINRPGLLQDISQGYNENRFTPASLDNLQQNTLANGREKGFAYRLGEGLGSLVRFGESPRGRALITAGLVGATGGGALPALAFGTQTGFLNQANRMKDELYRRELAKYGFDTSGIRGYIGDDTFNKYLQSKQMQDNAEYRNLLLQTQMQNQADLLKLKQQEAERQAKQDAFDNYYKGQNIAQGWAQIYAANNKPKPLSDSQVKDLKGTTEFINSLDNIIGRYSDAKYDSLFGIKGDIRRNNPFSRYDAGASLFKQDVEILRQRYAKLLEGGRLSDSDRAFYQKALFNPNTSRKDFLEAARRMKATLQQDYKNSLSMYAKQGKDISEFYIPDNQQNNQNADPLGIL